MDGVAALRFVLVADATLLGLVPEENIFAGPMPLDMQGPAISLQSISTSDLNIPTPAATRLVTERVQATIRALNYPSQKAIEKAVKRAAADQLYPSVPGISGVTIHTAGAGPDFVNEALSLWQGSQDFSVKYNQAR